MRIVIVLVFFSISFSVKGNDIDYKQLKSEFPEADYVVLEKEIKLSYFINPVDSNLYAKSKHNISVLVLNDNCEDLERILLSYNSFTELNVLSARYFILDSANESHLVENIKVKALKPRDYYVDGVLYGDLKVKEISSLSKLKERVLIKYSYEYIYKDTRFLNIFQIQELNENINDFKLEIEIPDYVKVNFYPFNFNDTSKILDLTTDGIRKITYKTQKILEKKTNKYSPPSDYYLPGFIVTTCSYTYNGSTINILNSTQELYNWYNNLIEQLKPDRNKIKQLADEIVKDKNTPEEKTEAIFKWVQKNVHYIAFEDGMVGFKPDEADMVMKRKYGDCKGMANLLVELLKAEDIAAYHTWIGTRHLSYPLYTNSLAVFNHMICAVYLNNSIYYLDATNKAGSWNKIPSYLHGKDALIGKGKDFEVKRIPFENADINTREFNISCKFSNDFRILKANLNFNLTGEEASAIFYLKEFSSLQDRDDIESNFLKYFIKSFVSDSQKINFLKYSPENIEIVSFGELQGASVFDGKKIYLFLDQIPLFNISQLDIETPVYFENKKKIVVRYKILLPEKVKIVDLPDSKSISTSDNCIKCDFTYSNDANELIFTKTIIIDTLLLEMKNSISWKKVLDDLLMQETRPIKLSVVGT